MSGLPPTQVVENSAATCENELLNNIDMKSEEVSV